jgi:hypothetical protein
MLRKLTHNYVCYTAFRRKFLARTPTHQLAVRPNPTRPQPACNFPRLTARQRHRRRSNRSSEAGAAPPPHTHPTARHYTPPPHPDKTRSGRRATTVPQSPRHRRSIGSDSAWLWRLPVTASSAAAARSRFLAASRWLLTAFMSVRAIGGPRFSVSPEFLDLSHYCCFPFPNHLRRD